jgi:hypothetical protein
MTQKMIAVRGLSWGVAVHESHELVELKFSPSE